MLPWGGAKAVKEFFLRTFLLVNLLSIVTGSCCVVDSLWRSRVEFCKSLCSDCDCDYGCEYACNHDDEMNATVITS